MLSDKAVPSVRMTACPPYSLQLRRRFSRRRRTIRRFKRFLPIPTPIALSLGRNRHSLGVSGRVFSRRHFPSPVADAEEATV